MKDQTADHSQHTKSRRALGCIRDCAIAGVVMVLVAVVTHVVELENDKKQFRDIREAIVNASTVQEERMAFEKARNWSRTHGGGDIYFTNNLGQTLDPDPIFAGQSTSEDVYVVIVLPDEYGEEVEIRRLLLNYLNIRALMSE